MGKILTHPNTSSYFWPTLMVESNWNSYKMQMNIVSLLVGFYTAMSFTGSMGAIMSGSGLQNAFETILGKKTQWNIYWWETLFQKQEGETFWTKSALNMLLMPQ